MTHSETKGTVLIVTSSVLWPVAGGGVSRTWSMIEHLRTTGYRVEVAAVAHPAHAAEISARVDRYWFPADPKNAAAPKNMAQQAKRWARRLRQAWPTRKQPISALQRNQFPSVTRVAAEAAWSTRPVAAIAVFAWMARSLDYMPPGVLRLIDTIDIQHTRADTARRAGGNLEHTACSREDEIAELTRADALIAIQPEEAESLREMCPDTRVITATHACAVPETLPAAALGHELLLVGNLYDPNVRGLQQFLREAWPAVRSACPEARLTVCGKIGEAFRSAPAGVQFMGRVDDLAPYYRRAALVINPVPYGSGLKIKTVEALAQCKPLVSTPEGIRGLGPAESLPLIVAENGAEMATAVLGLLAQPADRRALEERAWAYARAHLSPQAVYAELVELIEAHALQSSQSGLSPK